MGFFNRVIKIWGLWPRELIINPREPIWRADLGSENIFCILLTGLGLRRVSLFPVLKILWVNIALDEIILDEIISPLLPLGLVQSRVMALDHLVSLPYH